MQKSMHDTVDTVDDRVGASCLKVLVTQVLSTETGLFKLKITLFTECVIRLVSIEQKGS
jgi:hypothetical protein